MIVRLLSVSFLSRMVQLRREEVAGTRLLQMVFNPLTHALVCFDLLINPSLAEKEPEQTGRLITPASLPILNAEQLQALQLAKRYCQDISNKFVSDYIHTLHPSIQHFPLPPSLPPSLSPSLPPSFPSPSLPSLPLPSLRLSLPLTATTEASSAAGEPDAATTRRS